MASDIYRVLEVIASITGIINIYLIAKKSIWNYLFGLITVSIFLVIFYHVKLYADMSLQLIYLILQFYGWYQWLYGGAGHTRLNIIRVSHAALLKALLAVMVMTLLLIHILHYTDSTFIALDATTTAMSLVAQWMMSKKWLQHWWLWIVMNSISIVMYSMKALYVTSGLYAIYLGLCIIGYYQWRAEWQKLKPCR